MMNGAEFRLVLEPKTRSRKDKTEELPLAEMATGTMDFQFAVNKLIGTLGKDRGYSREDECAIQNAIVRSVLRHRSNLTGVIDNLYAKAQYAKPSPILQDRIRKGEKEKLKAGIEAMLEAINVGMPNDFQAAVRRGEFPKSAELYIGMNDKLDARYAVDAVVLAVDQGQTLAVFLYQIKNSVISPQEIEKIRDRHQELLDDVISSRSLERRLLLATGTESAEATFLRIVQSFEDPIEEDRALIAAFDESFLALITTDQKGPVTDDDIARLCKASKSNPTQWCLILRQKHALAAAQTYAKQFDTPWNEDLQRTINMYIAWAKNHSPSLQDLEAIYGPMKLAENLITLKPKFYSAIRANRTTGPIIRIRSRSTDAS